MLQKFPYSTSSHSSVPGNHSPLPSQFCRVQMPQHWAHMVCSLPDGLLSLNNRHLSFISVSMAWQLISFYCLIIFHCMNKCSPLSTHSATKDILGLPSSVLPNKAALTPQCRFCGRECSAPLGKHQGAQLLLSASSCDGRSCCPRHRQHLVLPTGATGACVQRRSLQTHGAACPFLSSHPCRCLSRPPARFVCAAESPCGALELSAQ